MIDEGPREVHVRIERHEGRRAERIAWIGLVLVVVAIMKPWGGFGQPSATGVPVFRATPVPEPTEQVVAVELPCIGGRWSIESDERWVGTIVRTWVLTDAVEVDAPTDPAIRFVTVAAQQVISLGFCPPFHDAAPNATATFFRLDADGDAVTIMTFPIKMPSEAEAMANTLYRFQPPAAASGDAAATTWPAGRYVIRVDAADTYRRWLGVDVRLIVMPGDLASPVPTAN